MKIELTTKGKNLLASYRRFSEFYSRFVDKLSSSDPIFTKEGYDADLLSFMFEELDDVVEDEQLNEARRTYKFKASKILALSKYIKVIEEEDDEEG